MKLSEEEVANDLITLLKIYSPPGKEKELHQALSQICRKWGFEECYVDDVGNFFAEYGEGKTILLASHLDTVPGWLEVSFDGEFIHGRGAVDAKGPLLAFILGAAMAKQSVSGVKVQVAGLVHEESDGLGAKYLVEKEMKADYVLIGEPTNFGIAIAYRGSITAEAIARARGGHSSAPYIGESALDKLLSFLNEFRSRFRGSSYDEITSAVTMLNAGDWPSKLPEEAHAHINLRFPKTYNLEKVSKELLNLAERHGVELRIIDETPPVEVKLNSKAVRALMRGCLKNGIKPKIVKKTGTSDMNVLAKLTEHIAAFGPGDSRLAHTNSEVISVSDVIKASKVISAAIIELAKQ